MIEAMNILTKIYIRAYQKAFYIAYPFLPYREPQLVEGGTSGITSVLDDNNKKKPLVITDRGVIDYKLFEPLKSEFEKNSISYVLFDKVVPNPTTAVVEEALSLYKENNCDVLIAIGGGSSMDTAKAVGARIANPKKSLKQMKGILKVRHKIPLLIAIPTTAGTGSEATLAAVVVDGGTRDKYAINDFPLIPRYAVLDPSYTLTLPPSLTATTGIDALTHAIEAYIGKSSFKLTRREAKVAIRLIFNNIEKAYMDGTNKEARFSMSKAAYLAGCAFTRSYVGYVHALSHALSGKYNTPHGLANAVMLPYVLEEYGKSVYPKLRKLAICIGIADELDDEKTASLRFINEVKKLNARLNIPTTLEIKEEDIQSLVNHAYKEAHPLYPTPELWNKERMAKVYRRVMNKE